MANMHTTLLKFFQEYKKQSWGGGEMVLGDNLFSNGKICHQPKFKNGMILEVFNRYK
jgi:hypothetical protein